eukprot:scaffold157173_cov33-Tisochrysis_lutea.AAC.1
MAYGPPATLPPSRCPRYPGRRARASSSNISVEQPRTADCRTHGMGVKAALATGLCPGPEATRGKVASELKRDTSHDASSNPGRQPTDSHQR